MAQRKTGAPPAEAGPQLDSSAKSPQEIWDDYFSKRRPSPDVVNQLILNLHQERKHEHVIAAIEAALKNGQSQPWMYDVLALSMELAGRPKPEIERVLLSRVDFTATDVPSMLYSAAYLTRFGGRTQALRLYRQASVLEPTQPEPYVLGLALAREQKDFDAIRWAAAGILVSAWGRDHEQLHLRAGDAAVESVAELRKSGRNAEADGFERAINEACQRDLVVELTWSGEGDLDLSVEEPAGTLCAVDNPQSRGGGVHVRDGYGPDQKNCREQYVCAFGVPGNYRVRVRHIDGNIVGKRAQVTIGRSVGSSDESKQTFSVPISRVDATLLVSLPGGRRTELKPAEPKPATEGASKKRPGQAMLPNTSNDAAVAEARRRFGASREREALISGGRPARKLIAAQAAAGGQRAADDESPEGGIGPFAQSGAPGVGAGAVGYQPVITTLSEGVSSGALAVVSGDRRYVRLSVSPMFSTITDVFTFTFLNSSAPGGQPSGN